jgi:DNA-binding NarL/FixJ family response regulator
MVVDDHPLMREGIVSQLRRGHGIKVVGEASNGAELLRDVESFAVDVVLLDLQMPEINGAQVLTQLKRQLPHLKILVFSMFNERRMMREMIRLGANGYVTKDIGAEDLIDAIYNVHYRGYHAQDDFMRELLARESSALKVEDDSSGYFRKLKDRDMIILSMICEGLSSEEIAPRLNISKQTVDLCRSRLITHFGARNAMHLVAKAIQLGFHLP